MEWFGISNLMLATLNRKGVKVPLSCACEDGAENCLHVMVSYPPSVSGKTERQENRDSTPGDESRNSHRGGSHVELTICKGTGMNLVGMNPIAQKTIGMKTGIQPLGMNSHRGKLHVELTICEATGMNPVGMNPITQKTIGMKEKFEPR